MSISGTIKASLKSKVQSCSTVQVVYGYEEVNPSGFPAAIIKAADMQGEFASNAENSRVYAYNVYILFPIGQDFIPPANKNRLEYAEDVISEVIDEIINAIDTDFELDGTPTLYTEATDASWGEYEYSGGVAKAAQITIKVRTDKTVI